MALFSAKNNVSMQTQTVDKLFKSWDDYFFSILLLNAGNAGKGEEKFTKQKIAGNFAEPLSAQMFKLIVRLWKHEKF